MRWILSGALVLFCLSASAAEPATTVFTGVTVIDVEAGKPLTDRTVVVTGTKITSVVATDGFKPPQGATVVRANGKFLIPGLWDMHVHHLAPFPGQLELALANGVTGVRDLNTEAFLLTWRDEIAAGKRVGPRIVASGKYLDAKFNGQPLDRISVDTPDQARELVRQRKKAGVNLIKVYSGLSPEVYRAVLEEAKIQGLPVAGHCPERVPALTASELGQRSIEHLSGIALSCTRGEAALRKELASAFVGKHGYDITSFYPILATAMDTPDEQKQAALFAAFKKNRTWQVPTLVVQRPLPAKGTPEPRLKYAHWAIAALWERVQENDQFGKFRKKSFTYAQTTVKAMHKAGVPLLAGTDAGGPFNVHIFPGFSLADELELLVGCGLTSTEALRAATLNPALYLGEEKTTGTVTVDKRADLVLLDANPLEAIGNVRKIAGVMANGRWHPRTELDQWLTAAESAAKKK